jgi:hypothetical protein
MRFTLYLLVWHEVFGAQEIDITVVPGEIRNADFTFDAEKTPENPKHWFLSEPLTLLSLTRRRAW